MLVNNSFSLTHVVPDFRPSGATSLIDLAFISSLYSSSTIPPLGTSDHISRKAFDKRTGASQHFLSYKCKRNKVVKLMRKAKRKFFRGLKTPNSKNFWKVAKFLTKINSSIPTLKNGERIVENDLDKATLLDS